MDEKTLVAILVALAIIVTLPWSLPVLIVIVTAVLINKVLEGCGEWQRRAEK